MLETVNRSIIGDAESPELDGALSAVPLELRRLFRLAPIYRYVFVARFLVGLPAASCARVLNLSAHEFEDRLETALTCWLSLPPAIQWEPATMLRLTGRPMRRD
jgi:hypothetical protein